MSEPILRYFNLSKKSVVSTSTFTRVFLNKYLYFYLSEGCVYFCHLCPHVTFVLIQNTKEDILKNVNIVLDPIDPKKKYFG